MPTLKQILNPPPRTMPRPSSRPGATGKIRPLPNGLAELTLGGQPGGIYPNIEAARTGLDALRRLGVAR